MARPRKPVALHLIQNTFRPKRHAHLLPNNGQPMVSSPEPHPLDGELEKWRGMFECGLDFFNATGMSQFAIPSYENAKRDAAERKLIAAARVAWKRLGRRFMETWVDDPERPDEPWALFHFGPPSPEPKRIAFEDLPDVVRQWSFYLETGYVLTAEQEGLNDAQIKRVGRSKWREHGPKLAAYWGPKRTRKAWAYRRYGEP
jgi:hypothetical protein